MVYRKPFILDIRYIYLNTFTALIVLMFMADNYEIQLKCKIK